MSVVADLEERLAAKDAAHREALSEALRWRRYAEQLERFIVTAQGRCLGLAQEFRAGVVHARQQSGLDLQSSTTTPETPS